MLENSILGNQLVLVSLINGCQGKSAWTQVHVSKVVHYNLPCKEGLIPVSLVELCPLKVAPWIVMPQ